MLSESQRNAMAQLTKFLLSCPPKLSPVNLNGKRINTYLRACCVGISAAYLGQQKPMTRCGAR
jgi:hypothetical protein